MKLTGIIFACCVFKFVSCEKEDSKSDSTEEDFKDDDVKVPETDDLNKKEDSDEGAGSKREEYSDYKKAYDILYKTIWRPRDCLHPLSLNDSVTMNMEWGTTAVNQKLQMDTSVALRIESEGISFKLDQKGLEGMCLGEKRNLVIPEARISSLSKEKETRRDLKTVLTIELVEVNDLKWTKLAGGLIMILLEKVDEKRCGRLVVDGDTLSVEYEGSQEDGTVFDSSKSRGQPFGPFKQGHHQIIRGYEIALHHRCLGERFKMIVPPELAYGEQGVGDLIPPDSTLYFDVRLVQLNEEHWSEDTQQKDVYSWERLTEGKCEFSATVVDDLYIHYLAKSSDGSEFGTLAKEKSAPYGPFRLGGPELEKVPGLGPAIEWMCLGEEKLVILPPKLGWEGQHDTIRVKVLLTQINENKADIPKDEL